jgi:hypothetical protein
MPLDQTDEALSPGFAGPLDTTPQIQDAWPFPPRRSVLLLACVVLINMVRLIRVTQLWVGCSVAFSLYIMRESFNDWTVDYFKTEGGAAMSSQLVALLSTPSDAAGAVGIVLLGWKFNNCFRRTLFWQAFGFRRLSAGFSCFSRRYLEFGLLRLGLKSNQNPQPSYAPQN